MEGLFWFILWVLHAHICAFFPVSFSRFFSIALFVYHDLYFLIRSGILWGLSETNISELLYFSDIKVLTMSESYACAHMVAFSTDSCISISSSESPWAKKWRRSGRATPSVERLLSWATPGNVVQFVRLYSLYVFQGMLRVDPKGAHLW